ncbi:MAG TPA: hypothetical protein VFM54_08945 [Micromonosporaceae bacterium]|nr:hypothetical protein [Micromonosporaceae bacterium]
MVTALANVPRRPWAHPAALNAARTAPGVASIATGLPIPTTSTCAPGPARTASRNETAMLSEGEPGVDEGADVAGFNNEAPGIDVS